VAAIKPKEGYVQRQPEEVQNIIQENAVQNEKLKDFFFKRRQTKKTRNRKRGSA